jgi:hypothetical protein
MDDLSLISFLVREINERVDLFGDWVTESQEENIITPVVELTVPYIPNFLRPLLIDASDGLDDAERQVHQTKLINYLHERIEQDMIEIPWYGRALIISSLKSVTEKLAELIFEYAQRGLSLLQDTEIIDDA